MFFYCTAHRTQARLISGSLALLIAVACRATESEPVPLSDTHYFTQQLAALPALGKEQSSQEWEKHLASIAKNIGEASQNSSEQTSYGQQAGIWAFNHLRDAIASRVQDSGQSLLSPYGQAQIELMVDRQGSFTGSGVSLFTPQAETPRVLTYSQLGIQDTSEGAVGNVGVGQRWNSRHWLMGYNTFLDRSMAAGQQRASLGLEAWSDSLRFSANYYHPLSGWKNGQNDWQQRMARGYDFTTQSYLPFYRQLGVSLNWAQYLGDNVDLFHSGNRYHNPSALSLGINYTPVPLITLSASHKSSSAGESQEQLSLKLNYRFGVALDQQLMADNVAEARSLRGSRYDPVTRSNTPVMNFRQSKTLSVFLATPPWQLTPGESLPLKLQIRHSHPVRAVSWQGDTQALSLTPPADNSQPQGWSVIVPAWDDSPDASNTYRLSVTLEDDRQQRVTSNWITLQVPPPMRVQWPLAQPQFDLLEP